MKNDIKIKYQAGNLIRSCCRNINDNFISVSFELKDNQDIQTKFIFYDYSEFEEEYVDDIIAEFSAMQESDCILPPIIEVEIGDPLENLVYSKSI